MSDIPSARVVRGGKGHGERAGAEVAPPGPVLRLAPRAVPRALVWRLYFGGPIAVLGWLFAAFGMVFVLVFLPMSDLGSPDFDREATATMTRIEDTSSSENERTIYRVRYTFHDEAGVLHHGASFTLDRPAELGPWPVRYRSDDPSESQLDGMRRGRFSPFVLLVAIFPIVGLGIGISQLRAGHRNLRLLRSGAETRGKLLGKEATGVYVNEQPVMALTFEYEAGGRTYTAKVKALDPSRLEDDPREPMLYDPRAPSRATTLDHLPGAPRIGAGGELEARPGVAFHLVIAPVLFVALVAATAIVMWLI
jgi:hypothetical protein